VHPVAVDEVETVEVEIPVPKGRPLRGVLASPSAARPLVGRPAIIVVHEILGIDEGTREVVRRFAENGYAALAPDFLGPGFKPLCIARFMQGVGRVHAGRPYRELERARRWLAERPDVDAHRIGVAGFCIGGGFALLYATRAGIQAVAPFYPQVPERRDDLAGICPTVASFGARDSIFGNGGPRLEAALAELGVDHDVKTYPEAGHAFMTRRGRLLEPLGRLTPMQAGYVESAAEDSWRRMLAFFERHVAAA